MAKHTEIRFEEAIEQSLLTSGGYEAGDAEKFDPSFGLFPEDIVEFVSVSQPHRWQSITDLHGEKAGDALISALAKELTSKNALHVLRHGFKFYGKTFRLANFAPNTSMNPQAAEDYAKNRLRVTRQVHFSEKNPNLPLDMVLSVNGLPVVTL